MEGKEKRRIAIIIGSQSDLPQCLSGLEYLQNMVDGGFAQVLDVHIASQHRNTLTVQALLQQYSSMPKNKKPQAMIIGAGWANHLTGCCDAFLRNALEDISITIVGVAFQDFGNHGDDLYNQRHDNAAKLSITEVPGTQVVFDDFVGPKGFLRACKFAVEANLPKIKLPQPKPTMDLTLKDAIIRSLALQKV